MDKREIPALVSGVLMVGFVGDGVESAPFARLEELAPAGIVLFSRNLSFPDLTLGFVESLVRRIPSVRWMAIDQEGGRVSRLAKWIGPTPPAARLAAVAPQFSRGLGRATGAALRGLGFNLDFAPVVDLCPVETPNGIGDRSFGTDPAAVVERAGEFLDGLQTERVAGCLKHFPGLGPTALDSHRALPTVSADEPELRSRHLRPFAELSGRAPWIMVGHGYYPTWAGSTPRPATTTPEIVHGLLRTELGYDGMIASDDMEMGAIAPQDEDGAMAVAAMEAGCDLLLYCKNLDRADAARRALIRRAESDPAFQARLTEAATRVREGAAGWPLTTPNRSLWAKAAADFDQLRTRVDRA